MSKSISDRSKLVIQLLLTDSKIAEKVFENVDDKEKYKICTIKNSGAVILGKTSCRFWNQLLNCQDKIPFESFALKVWDSLVDASSGINNTAIMKGLSQEIIMKSVREHEYDWVVGRLYDCWRHVAQKSEGYQQNVAPAGAPVNYQGVEKVTITDNGPRKIVLNINGVEKTIPILDSIGDTFNIGLDFGITGAHRIY